MTTLERVDTEEPSFAVAADLLEEYGFGRQAKVLRDHYERSKDTVVLLETSDDGTATAFNWDALHLCGCGDPVANIKTLTALLAWYEERFYGDPHDWVDHWTAKKAHYQEMFGIEFGSPLSEIIGHWMGYDGFEWLEHGSSVGGSWLSGQGHALLAELRKHDWDALEGEGVL